MDASQWPQQQVGGLAKTMEEIATQNNTISSSNNNNNQANSRTPMVEKRARPEKDQNLNCPRCNSANTKFCYYNNYSLTQPRYFCKTCRRYWTQGGSLRNIPVGGGSRKNKRSSTSSSSSSFLASTSSPSTKLIPDLMITTNSFSHLITASQNPKFLEGQDLNLAFPIQGIFQPLDHQLPKIDHHQGNTNNTNNENQEPIMNTSCTTTSSSHSGVNNNNNSAPISALELLRTGIAASRGSLNSYVPVTMPDSNTLYPNLQEFKPSMGVFTSPGDHHHHHDHHGNDNHMIGSGANNVEATGGARLLFPFADMNKLASSATAQHNEIDDQNEGVNDHHHHNHHHHHHHHQGPTGYWTGMLGGGTW